MSAVILTFMQKFKSRIEVAISLSIEEKLSVFADDNFDVVLAGKETVITIISS